MTMPRFLMVVYALFFCFVIWYGVLATRTFDGAVKDSYEKGMAYPAQMARLKELGWRFEGGPRQLPVGQPGTLELRIVNSGGQAVGDAEVTLAVARPASREALPILDTRETTPGVYQAALSLPGEGHWFVTATIRRHGEAFTHEFKIFADNNEAHHGT